MFPRIKKIKRKNTTYEYLVISESIYKDGKSYTKDIANLGNIKSFSQNDANSLIDGLVRIFKLEEYSLTDDIEIIESLEYGSIIFWKKFWDKLNLSKLIQKKIELKDKRIVLEVEKYIEMMTINRCIEPLSKLGATRWISETCYKEMKGYKNLSLDANLFYRSMDYLLLIKDELENKLYDRLKNLFSINVRMTFYDITSTYFHNESCPISANGYSRDHRPDKVQIIIGVITSYEGYPIKHYVFEGNTKDETTVAGVLKDLKKNYNIEETIFVGDRGMITKLNLANLIDKGYNYIMGVKSYQDEICQMLLTEEKFEDDDFEDYKQLKLKEAIATIKEFLKWKTREILKDAGLAIKDTKFGLLEKKIDSLDNKSKSVYADYKLLLNEIAEGIDSKISYKLYRLIKKYETKYEESVRYIICLNEERKKLSHQKREKYLLDFSKELDTLFSTDKSEICLIDLEKKLNKIFEGYKRKYRKYFQIIRDGKNIKAIGYLLNKEEIKKAKKLDGIFVLVTSCSELDKGKVVDSYKNLQEVEILFDDFKNFVEVRPIRHWLEKRVRAHVFICILSLLLKRIFEINYLGGKAVTEALEEVSKMKLIKYKIRFSKKDERSKIVLKATKVNTLQKSYFNMVDIKNPENLENFMVIN